MSCGDPVADPSYLKDLVAMERLEKAVSGTEQRKRTEVPTERSSLVISKQ